MVINWYGEGCFKIQSGGLTLLTDPFSSDSGLTPPRFKADITLRTITLPHTASETGEGEVHGPGEYEIKGVHVHGWAVETKEEEIRAAYLVKTEELSLAFLGSLGSIPSPEFLERAGAADILFLPVGGPPHLDGSAAAKLVKQLNPKIVIPSFFKVPGLLRKAEGVAPFLKELGKEATPEEKAVIKKKELPTSTQVVVLKV